MTLAAAMAVGGATGSPARADQGAPAAPPAETQARVLDIAEYRVEGVTRLSAAEVETALLPFVGPRRRLEDVERARAALEKAYSDRGYQAVTVAVPPQTVREGVIALVVTEGRIGRLRVKGSRYFSLNDIKRHAPSMAEGTVPNFNDIVRDIALLNQLSDRRVTPALQRGEAPGTIDVDLVVQDTLPLHAAVELNDRYSAQTTPLRLNGSLRYDNLWQAGHTVGFSFQIAPQRLSDAKVFSLFYVVRLADVPWLDFTLSGISQDSDVSTLGGAAVKGRGKIFGGRATFTLPGAAGFSHTLSAGVDYKSFDEEIEQGVTPIRYWPVTAQYAATWQEESALTTVGATAILNLPAFSNSDLAFDEKRYQATASFFDWKADLSRDQGLPGDVRLFGRIQVQYTHDPLIGPEQFTAGGAESVRGYLEAQVAGDRGAAATVEVRSPSLAGWFGKPVLDEWRFHAFADAAEVWVLAPLPEQKPRLSILSVGCGTRLRLLGHASGTLEVAVPLESQGEIGKGEVRFLFRVSGEF